MLADSTGIATSGRINNAATVTLAGGTLASANGANEGTAAARSGANVIGTSAAGLASLTLTANSAVDFDGASNGNLLVFGSGFNPGAFTLAVNNWTTRTSTALPSAARRRMIGWSSPRTCRVSTARSTSTAPASA